MIIDFHTHIFPDDLAPRAVKTLTAGTDYVLEPANDGTLSGLVKNMDDWGIDMSVIAPVITKQTQFKTVNDWAASLASDRIISFGSVFPHTDDYKRDIDYVVSLGLKGLKFHVEYQDFVLDDEGMLKVYDYALSKGLIILQHAGYDLGFPPPYKSTPQQFANVDKAMQGGIIIAAHLGGHAQWDDVEKYLVGSRIHLDTSMGFAFYPQEQFLRICKNHGADKLLFGSDSPWSKANEEIQHLRALPISDEEKSMILSGNAIRILHLPSVA
ncbi:MAG: amidohydrolase family protein [Clostridiales bacterium]|nr:amidohydrolase family protein [Clostridiales bacterium]